MEERNPETAAADAAATTAKTGPRYGWEPDVSSPEQLRRAVDAAFDYRGDVTVTLKDGSTVVGYIFNRLVAAGKPCLKMYPGDEERPRRIAYEDIAGLKFTGRDMAAGRSWDDWVKKHAARRAAGEKLEEDLDRKSPSAEDE